MAAAVDTDGNTGKAPRLKHKKTRFLPSQTEDKEATLIPELKQ